MENARFHELIMEALTKETVVPFSHGQIRLQTVSDPSAGEYLILMIGWDGKRRVHSVLAHLEVLGGQVVVQRDGTEYGIAQRLIDVGVPADRIVLGWQAPEPVTAQMALAA